MRKGGKDSIMQYNKERGIHTMKFVNRIFLVLGAMSMFSLVQFDAMGAQDCTSAPKAGDYCYHRNSKPKCPEGCWCPGGSKTHLSDYFSQQDVIKRICEDKSATVAQLTQMRSANVYVCGIDYSTVLGLDTSYDTGSNQGQSGGIHMRPESDKGKSAAGDCGVEWCSSNPGDGKYCANKNKIGCPAGCYCPGNVRRSVGMQWETVREACKNRTSGINDIGFDTEKYLNSRGVYYCPDGYTSIDNGIHTFVAGAVSINDCVSKTTGENYVAPVAHVTPSGLSEITKPVNGSGLTVVSSGNGTAYHCDPGQYLSNSTGSQLFNGTGSVTSSFNKFGTTCTDCPAGWYCPGDDEKYQCTGTRKYSTAGKSACSTCPAGRQANSTHTGCEPATINMGSTDVVAQRVDASDLVAPEAMCLNGGTPHSVNFVRGNGSASGSTSSFNNRCQGDTITLPDCGFSLPEHTFNLWSCDNNIGTKVAGATFTMPDANVTCAARWTDSGSTGGDNGGDTGGSTGGDNGGGTGGSTGGDNGGGTGGSTGGDNGGGTGGSTGGDNGGGTGGSTGGDNTGDGDGNTPVSCTTPGKYWNGDYCENCESGYFCPGDGDEYRCPLSGTTTTNRASCRLNVSKTQMYGNNGNKCWKYTGVSRASDYRDCVYGDHLESYLH